ncbi:MAG: transcriptional repressor LexA [Clostridia bacterium]|nr:transcriptional repressor LexA [Clostridia bacterium]
MRRKNEALMKDMIRYVEEYRFENHSSPTIRKIAARFDISVSTAEAYLVEMNARGLLRYRPKDIQTSGTAKTDSRMTRVPVIGSVVCGSPEFAEEDFEEFVPLPVALFGEGEFFILRTHGDSMIGAGIEEGDMVVVRRSETARPGEIVVALVENETTLKTFYPEPEQHRVRLHPENPAMEDIFVPSCNVQGVACHVIKKLKHHVPVH